MGPLPLERVLLSRPLVVVVLVVVLVIVVVVVAVVVVVIAICCASHFFLSGKSATKPCPDSSRETAEELEAPRSGS